MKLTRMPSADAFVGAHRTVSRVACFMVLCSVGSAWAQTSPSPIPEKRFFDRLDDVLKKDPNFVRNVLSQRELPPELESFKWMLGTWKASAKAFQTPSRPERALPDAGSFIYKTVPDSSWIWGLSTREGSVLMPHIGYDQPSKRYLIDSCNGAGVYGLLISPGPKGESITFEGDVTVFGISAHFRRTYTKTKPSEFEIFNEERMADGTWVPVDRYYLTRAEEGQTTPPKR